ncbi:MAG: preQ(1) synthase [Verrucomicrobiia bacterium]
MHPDPSSPQAKPRFLGVAVEAPPARPDPAIIDTFENRYPHRDYSIRFDCSDFTSLCPVTAQPDYASLCITYYPATLCIETKSLKLYLASFRNERCFNEEIVNRILDDLCKACAPKMMRVTGTFASRGGISLTASAEQRIPDFTPPGV